MKKFLLSFFLLSQSFALEVDEKLTARFLKVSESRKTILLNRGLEDGLVVGDHAKFFLTTGVVARGAVVKASPTRTIWSLYRLVDGSKIFSNKVVNIKISTPVEITDDPSRALRSDMIPQGVEVVQSEDSLVNENEMDDLTSSDQADLKDFKEGSGQIADIAPSGSYLNYKSIEVFGLFHISSLGSTIDQQSAGSYSGSDSSFNFTAGLEKYFTESKGFFKTISISAFIHRNVVETTSISNRSITLGVFEYGGAINFHFNENPRSNQMIYFGQIGAGLGSVEDTIQDVSGSGGTSNSVEGTSNFFQFGLGSKYYLRSGFGFRAKLDYYIRNETYKFDNSGEEFTKKLSGPRIMLGLSYRF